MNNYVKLAHRFYLLSKQEGVQLSDFLENYNRFIKKPPIKGDIVLFKGFYLREFKCPSCDRPIGDEQMMFFFCPSCGQKIDRDKADAF